MTNATSADESQRLSQDQDDIRHYVSAQKFYEDALAEQTDVFCSYTSFKAFLLRHQQELTTRGLYISRQGSVGSLVRADIVSAIPEILRAGTSGMAVIEPTLNSREHGETEAWQSSVNGSERGEGRGVLPPYSSELDF